MPAPGSSVCATASACQWCRLTAVLPRDAPGLQMMVQSLISLRRTVFYRERGGRRSCVLSIWAAPARRVSCAAGLGGFGCPPAKLLQLAAPRQQLLKFLIAAAAHCGCNRLHPVVAGRCASQQLPSLYVTAYCGFPLLAYLACSRGHLPRAALLCGRVPGGGAIPGGAVHCVQRHCVLVRAARTGHALQQPDMGAVLVHLLQQGRHTSKP